MKKLKKFLKTKLKGFDRLDCGLIKAAAFFFTLFLISVIPALATWAQAQNIWLLLGITVVLMIRPCYKGCIKSRIKKK